MRKLMLLCAWLVALAALVTSLTPRFCYYQERWRG
jgi:hypothetical protein